MRVILANNILIMEANQIPLRIKFKTLAVAWLNHKMILAEKSFHYNQPERKKVISFVKNYFGDFMKTPTHFSAVKAARVFLKNENKMRNILPSTANPSYTNSEQILNEIIKQARQILIQEYET